MELTVQAPPDFTPEQGSAPAPQEAPPTARDEGTAWERYCTPEQGARVIAYARHMAARGLHDPALEPDKMTLELLGPPLAACARQIPVGKLTGGLAGRGDSAKWAVVGMVVILALAVGIPLLLAYRRRARAAALAAAEDPGRPIADAPSTATQSGGDPWGAGRRRFVGTGVIEGG